jgi:hypothetical protein
MTENCKVFKTENYNYIFNRDNGFFARWGKTSDDDPLYSPFGPEILDLEVSTICGGIDGINCSHCYKSNSVCGENMNFQTFKSIFHKMPETLTQIAFGVGDIDGNPDLFDIFHYCIHNKYNKVVPNITINGFNITDEIADKLVKYCGAVAVSRYDRDYCYNTVQKLISKGMKQINIHMLVCEETYDSCLQVMKDYHHDKRLKGLNAIVFLLLKPKGEKNNFTIIKEKKYYKDIINYAFSNNINIGFDSCFAPLFLGCIKGRKDFKKIDRLVESCESTLFSSYINVKGLYYPCSFVEDEWKGIDVLNCNDFIKDVWYGEETVKFREKLLKQENIISKTCRFCPVFDIY